MLTFIMFAMLPNTTLNMQNYKGENKPQRIAELQTGRIFLKNDENMILGGKTCYEHYLKHPNNSPIIMGMVKEFINNFS